MKKLFVVEDNESLSRGIVYALEKEGWLVEKAATKKEFGEKFYNEKFELILLDVMLPDGNGFDICKEVRLISDIPIIFLTACDEEVNIVFGLDLGADDYITKPFRIKELISRIKSALRRSCSNKVLNNLSTLSSKDIELNIKDCKITKHNVEIVFTPTEFKLMSILMQNSEVILGRNQILGKLWDVDGEFIDDNTLSVYISRLRDKIEENPSQPEYIVTVRGLGYKWVQRSNWA